MDKMTTDRDLQRLRPNDSRKPTESIHCPLAHKLAAMLHQAGPVINMTDKYNEKTQKIGVQCELQDQLDHLIEQLPEYPGLLQSCSDHRLKLLLEQSYQAAIVRGRELLDLISNQMNVLSKSNQLIQAYPPKDNNYIDYSATVGLLAEKYDTLKELLESGLP